MLRMMRTEDWKGKTMKKLFVLLLAVAMLLSLAACGGDGDIPEIPAPSEAADSNDPADESASQQNTADNNHPVDAVKSVEIMTLGSGESNSITGLEMTRKLNRSNGKYVNLYVENNGSNSVVATINGQSERTFQPGEKGCIYVEVTQGFLGTDKDYAFKVVTGTNGGSVNIHYEITQRDTQCREE